MYAELKWTLEDLVPEDSNTNFNLLIEYYLDGEEINIESITTDDAPLKNKELLNLIPDKDFDKILERVIEMDKQGGF